MLSRRFTWLLGPGWTSGRIGGAVFLPGVHGGLYLDVGEILDLACGLVGYDIVQDDGHPKFSLPSASAPAPAPPAS